MRKIAFLFLLFWNMPLSAQDKGDSFSITIIESKSTVDEILKAITQLTEYDFSFNSKVLKRQEVISFGIENASLSETLTKLSDQLNISFSIIENQIILTRSQKVDKYILSGFLSDRSSGEILISASVALKGSSKGMVTNEFGYYAFPLSAGQHTIVYSYVGFEEKEMELDITKNLLQDISLKPQAIDLPQVIVSLSQEEVMNKKQLGELELSPDELNSLPEFAGEAGLINGLHSFPGLKMHGDGSAFFYARGGERDQNVIIIDDAPIFNPSHLLGFHSLVIPEFTKSIKVYKSDMPASMGDRLSSIVSIRTRDGNLNKASFSGSINPFINRLSFETPLIKKRSAIFVSLRRSNYEWIYKPSNNNFDYFFRDFHFKWNFKINDKNRLYFTTVQSNDFFTGRNGPISNINWGNATGTLRWNHIFGPKLFSNTTFYLGTFGYRFRFPPSLWKSELGMVSLKTDFTHYANERTNSKFGVEFQRYLSTPGQFTTDSTLAIIPTFNANASNKFVLYYQGAFDLSDKLKLNAGVRITSWTNEGPNTYYNFDENYELTDTVTVGDGPYNSYFNIDPRLSLQYKLDNSSHLKLSFGQYHQYLQLILNSVSPFNALEVWLTSSPNIQPQYSSQFALSYLKHFEKAKMEISSAIYYKFSKNQIDYKPHATTLLNPLIEGELRFGESQSYGFEFMLRKDFGKLNGRLSYTYSRVFRTTEGINNGEPYRALQDRPHDLSLVLNYQASRRILCSANWNFYNGSTFTSPVGFYNFTNEPVPIYGERNNDRLPNYQRLDFAIKFVLNKNEDSKFKQDLTFSIYNMLAHKNTYSIKFNKLESTSLNPLIRSNTLSEAALSPSELYLIQFFPSLTYKFKL